MKIYKNLHLHMKIMCWRFHIKIPFTFWDMHTWDMWKVCLQTFRNNKVCSKLAYFLRNLGTSRANNSRILIIKTAKFSGYCFCMNTNIYGDFQIYNSVPLIAITTIHKNNIQIPNLSKENETMLSLWSAVFGKKKTFWVRNNFFVQH